MMFDAPPSSSSPDDRPGRSGSPAAGPPSDASPDTSRRGTGHDDGDRLTALREGLVSWAMDSRERETVALPIGPSSDGPDGPSSTRSEYWSIAEVVYELWDDHAPLPTGVCVALDLRDGTTFAELSRLLFTLWTDDGPVQNYGQAVESLVLRSADHPRQGTPVPDRADSSAA